MKKLLIIFGVVGLTATSTASVVACSDPKEPPTPPVEKKELTDELLKEFVKENNVINYSGPFLFEEGRELDFNLSFSNDSLVIGHLALEEFYKIINKEFNYSGYSFLKASPILIEQSNKLIQDSNSSTSFKMQFRYRSNNKFNEAYNDWLDFTFNFIQTEQISGQNYLETFFSHLINTEFYENNKGMSTSYTEKITNHYNKLGIDVTTAQLKDLEGNKLAQLELLTTEFYKGLLYWDENSTSIDLVKIEVTNFKLLEEYDEYHDAYSLDLKIALKDDENVFIEKQINTILTKN